MSPAGEARVLRLGRMIMQHLHPITALLAATVLLAAGGCESNGASSDTAAATPNGPGSTGAASGASCPPAAAQVVQQFGARMRLVSLLAPDSIFERELTNAYGELAADARLRRWMADPATAPGREVSSPWPARIVITEQALDGERCRVRGTIEYVTSQDTATAVERRPVALELENSGGWKIATYDASRAANPSRGDSAGVSEEDPKAVVQRYYAAIDARRYTEAYRLWGQQGRASGKTLSEFTAGFANTRDVEVSVADSVRREGAAGSQYATVFVSVDATLTDGDRQHFSGSYTLRRSMVDGATPEQRAWHIQSAELSAR